MGHFEISKQKIRNMDMKDITELCVLGFLFDDMRTDHGLIKAIRTLELGNWQPVREVIEETLLRLLQRGCVESLPEIGTTYYSITPQGIRWYFTLIKRPLAFDPSVRLNCVALKSYFVETVPDNVRRLVVDELVGYYHCQLCALQDGCSLCPLNSARQKHYTERQIKELKYEIDWLKKVR